MKRILILIENAYSYAGTENVCNFMTMCFSDAEIKLVSLNGSGETFYPFSNVNDIISLETSDNKWRDYKLIEKSYDPEYVFVISMGRLSVVFALNLLLRLINKKRKYYACEHIAFESHKKLVKLLKLLTLKLYSKVVVLTSRDEVKLQSYGISACAISNPSFYKNFKRNSRSYIALAVGRLEYQKGFDILIDIWGIFSKMSPHWVLKIVGDGSMRELLECKIKKMNLENSIQLVGRSDDVNYYYRSSDVLVVTSRYEGLPMTMLEAKSWSMPIVSFDCPTGPKELIENGCDGFLVQLDNKEVFAQKLHQLDNDALYYNFVNNIGDTIKKIDSDSIKKKWKNLLD